MCGQLLAHTHPVTPGQDIHTGPKVIILSISSAIKTMRGTFKRLHDEHVSLIFMVSCYSLLLLFVFSLSGELVALTSRFTDELMNQGLTKRILTLVSEINVTREFEKLQKERGLGNEKHRKEVTAKYLC